LCTLTRDYLLFNRVLQCLGDSYTLEHALRFVVFVDLLLAMVDRASTERRDADEA
jgi:hypothetical protein